jgi:hypothetical protein
VIVHPWTLSCATIAYQLNTTVFPMKKSAQSKETAMGKEFIQKRSKQLKIASNSVMQHRDAVGSPFIHWFLCVSFLKIVHPSMIPVKIASLERGAALMKLYQAQLKSPQQLLKSPQQLLKSPQQLLK